MASTTTAALVHARCGCSPSFKGRLSSPSPSPSPPSSSSSSSPPSSSSLSVRLRYGPYPPLLPCINSLRKKPAIKAQPMSTSSQGSLESPRGAGSARNEADHLLVLVHGILASTSDWIYVEAELKRRLGRNFLIYSLNSLSNVSFQVSRTFDGIDAAGRRLADEVAKVVQKTDGLKKISFLAHSLGRLFARYAVAMLYSPKSSTSVQPNSSASSKSSTLEKPSIEPGLIAGLAPVNFITLATPHLGVRGRKAGMHGKIFFSNCSHQKTLDGLRLRGREVLICFGCIQCRILYANVSYDHMVGWRTSSIRRETNLLSLLNVLWMVINMSSMLSIAHHFALTGLIFTRGRKSQRGRSKCTHDSKYSGVSRNCGRGDDTGFTAAGLEESRRELSFSNVAVLCP
ncbi:hypothetical protein MLD38_010082 [Melastoma candidum]|uniref:Uncharacterized protein n=1 Tax=Melastoma candidum TaxID=119954 RepID=A0ACB9QYR7_9MYRT|nr:hypothetical protein MLD38_010082 [Melastoma candidum]